MILLFIAAFEVVAEEAGPVSVAPALVPASDLHETGRATTVRLALGFAARLEREVNPGFADAVREAHFAGGVHFDRWMVLMEAGQHARRSEAGGLSIRAETWSLSTWARYDLVPATRRWVPFAAAGGGVHFDRVTSRFKQQMDISRGRRWMGGAGLGLTRVYWSHLLLEAEARAGVAQDERDPELALIVRAGVEI